MDESPALPELLKRWLEQERLGKTLTANDFLAGPPGRGTARGGAAADRAEPVSTRDPGLPLNGFPNRPSHDGLQEDLP